MKHIIYKSNRSDMKIFSMEQIQRIPFMTDVVLTPAALLGAVVAIFGFTTSIDSIPLETGALPIVVTMLFTGLFYFERWREKRIKNEARKIALEKFSKGEITAEELRTIIGD